MAGNDFRLTALLSVRDTMSPAIKAVSSRWDGFRKTIDSTEFRNLQKRLRLFNRSLKNTVDSAADAAVKIAGPFAGIVASLGMGVKEAVTGFAAAGDAVDKMAARVGLSAETLQEWSFAAKHAGASPEALENGLKDLSKHMAEIASGSDTTSSAATLFKALGIAVKDAGGKIRPVAEVFEEFADAIKRNEDPALRTRMAMAALGEGGRSLIPMMSAGSEGLREMSKQARDLGLVMSSEDVTAAANLTDHLDDMRAVFGSIGTTIGAKLAPVVVRLADQFRDLVAANREAFSARFAAVATQFAESFSRIDFQGIANAVLTVADVSIRAFNAVGGFNTVLYGMGALMAGKAVTSVITFGSNLLTLGRTMWGLATAARTVGIAMAGALGPVGLVITGVAAAAAVVAANWDSIWPVVKAGASACANWVSGAWQSMAHGLTGVWQAVKAGFAGAWNFVTDSLGASVKDGLANVWTMVKGFFAGLDFASLIPSGVRKIFDVLFGRQSNGLAGVWQTVKAGFADTWHFVTDSLGASVKDGLANVWTMVKDFFAGLDFASLIPSGVRKVFDVLLGRRSSGSTTSSDASAADTAVTPILQPMPVPRLQPAAQMSGRMAIQVTAAGGTSAQITDVAASDGLSILGSVGRSDRSYSGSD